MPIFNVLDQTTMGKKNVIKTHLKFFIEPHRSFVGTEEEIFTPVKNYDITFWFEGGFEIVAVHNATEINFNSDELLVLAIRDQAIERIIRIPWKRVVAFELLVKDKTGISTNDLIYLKPERKN